MEPVELTLRNYLRDNFLYSEEQVQAVNRDDSFLELGLLDSQGVMELVGFVESNWGISIADSDLTPEHFDSLAGIQRYLNKRLQEATPNTGKA